MILKDIFSKIKPRFLIRTARTALSSYLKRPKAYSLPLRLQVENGVGCNLKCKMCALNNMHKQRGFMSFSEFKTIYDKINPFYLNMTGYTDPFLNKDIFKMIEYAKNKGSYVRLDSNAMLLNEKMAIKLIKSKADYLGISIDGSTQKIYGKIRKGGNLNIVLENTKKILELKKKYNSSLKITASIIAQKDNIRDLLNLLWLLDDFGLEEINIIPVVEFDIKSIEKLTLKNKFKDLKKVYEKISSSKFKTKINTSFIEEYIKDYEKKEIFYHNQPCYVPWYTTYINMDGDVAPCCYFYDKQVIFGNIFKEDFKTIWNNLKYREFRKIMIEKGRIRKICQTCRYNDQFFENIFKIIDKIPLMKMLSNRS